MTLNLAQLMAYIEKYPNTRITEFNIKLLISQIEEYCSECENDRMMCVLAPSCYHRMLLDLRIEAGAAIDGLPKFCYSQSLQNFKRYLDKKTTLYTPKDTMIFNEDFLSIMFPKIGKDLYSALNKGERQRVIDRIYNSKVPGIEFTHENMDLFKRLLTNPKLIRPGTFFYKLSEKYAVFWMDYELFILNLAHGYSKLAIDQYKITRIELLSTILDFLVATAQLSYHIISQTDNYLYVQLQCEVPKDQPLSSFFYEGEEQSSEEKKEDGLVTEKENQRITFDALLRAFKRLGDQVFFHVNSDNKIHVTTRIHVNESVRERFQLHPLTLHNIRRAFEKLLKFLDKESLKPKV